MAAWKATRVGVVLRAAAVEHRRQIGAAAEPGLAGDDMTGVHVYGRHVRILRMRNQRNAGGPEARIVRGAGDFLAEFRRELAVHGRAMHADFLEHAPAHQRHHAAAAGLAAVVGALPRRAHEAAGRPVATAAPWRAGRLRPPRRPRRYRRASVRTRRARASCVPRSVGSRQSFILSRALAASRSSLRKLPVQSRS